MTTTLLSSVHGSSGIAEQMPDVDLRAMLDANLAEDMTYINQLSATITSEIRLFDDIAAGQSQHFFTASSQEEED